MLITVYGSSSSPSGPDVEPVGSSPPAAQFLQVHDGRSVSVSKSFTSSRLQIIEESAPAA